MDSEKSIAEICNDLSLVVDRYLESPYEVMSTWLKIASSVVNVETDITRYDTSFGWCRDGDHYTLAQQTLYKKSAKSLCVFSFVWGAVEAMVGQLQIPNKKKGKIRAASQFISKGWSHRMMLEGYLLELAQVIEIINENSLFIGIRKKLGNHTKVGLPGMGLYLVYSLRNEFAHGSLTFPSPDFDNEPSSNHHVLVEKATRLVLMSLQMVIINDQSEKLNYELYSDEMEDFEQMNLLIGVSPLEIIRSLHKSFNMEITNYYE